MNQVNERWQREHTFKVKLTIASLIVAAVCWPISYETSYLAATTGQGMWFASVSIVTLLGAIGTTIGGIVGAITAWVDNPPLEGANG
jgi:hypothetical protein